MTELLSVKKLSERISIPAFTIRKLAREGKIPSSKMGKRYLFDPQDVINVIKSNSSNKH